MLESALLQHVLLYLRWLTFFHTETSWLFFFEPCARFKTIFVKIGPRVMTLRCVIARWVNEKLDFPLKLHINRVFCLFVHFHYVLSYLFGLFVVKTCISILWHTSLLKKATFVWKKIAKNDDFGDFKRFSRFLTCVTYDVTVTSYKVCSYFFLVPMDWGGS